LPWQQPKIGRPDRKPDRRCKPTRSPRKIQPFYQCKSLPIIKLGVKNEKSRGKGRAISLGFARDGFLFLDKTKFPASFAPDADPEKAAFMADSQVPWGLGAI
jgi:hypothetical protein